jgi:hypothetical protein
VISFAQPIPRYEQEYQRLFSLYDAMAYAWSVLRYLCLSLQRIEYLSYGTLSKAYIAIATFARAIRACVFCYLRTALASALHSSD